MEKRHQDENLFSLLNSLLKAFKELKSSCNPIIFALYCSSSDCFFALQTLIPQTEKFLQLRNQPQLSKSALLLRELTDLINTERSIRGFTFPSVLHRHFIGYQIYQVSTAMESEIQGFLDREIVKRIRSSFLVYEDGECVGDFKVTALRELEKRVDCKFDGNLQETILKGKVFGLLEKMLSDPGYNTTVKEQAAACVLALVRFNKDVFCEMVLMGSIIPDLISMASSCSIGILASLMKLIQTPLIDEIERRGGIKKIVSLFETEGVTLRMRVIDCLYEIAYMGRSEAVKELLELRIVEKLIDLQRAEGLGYEEGAFEDEEVLTSETRWLDCVSRLAIQVQIGQGLSRKEKRMMKFDILERIKEASKSEAEAMNIISEVLWGPFY